MSFTHLQLGVKCAAHGSIGRVVDVNKDYTLMMA